MIDTYKVIYGYYDTLAVPHRVLAQTIVNTQWHVKKLYKLQEPQQILFLCKNC